MKVEWDPEKAEANVTKHGVLFEEAVTALEDPLSATFADPDRDPGELRFVTTGLSSNGRILVVGHTDRGEAVRIITARPATPRERKFYEKGK